MIVTENEGASPGSYDPALRLGDFTTTRRAFLAGRDTPRDLLERCLDVIERDEPRVRAFAFLAPELARAAADAATERYRDGRPRSPLDGCPIGIKDTIETRDMPTQMSSPLFKGWMSGRDAACVHALRQSGAVILGKTHVPELAMGKAPPTRSPFDSRRTAGASSSGSGAAPGAGMVPVAIGNQTGGSLIRPASYNAIYGFKPTFGALNIGGMHPIAPSQDHIGPMAASLADAWSTAWQISTRAGGHGGHPGLAGEETPPAPQPPRALARLHTVGWSALDPATMAAFEAAVARIAEAGIAILDRDNDADVATLEQFLLAADDISNDIIMYEVRWPLVAYLESRGRDKIGTAVMARLEHGLAMSPSDYRNALARRDAIRRQVGVVAAKVSAFCTLASSGPAPIVDGEAPAGADAPQAHLRTGSRSFLSPWSMVGGPSLSLPYLSVDAMPVGLQLMGVPDTDPVLFAHAAWLDGRFRP